MCSLIYEMTTLCVAVTYYNQK